MSSSRFMCVSFKIILRQKPIEVMRIGVEKALSQSCNSTERESVLCRLRVTPLGFCLRIIVNKKHINLEQTISSVLSVIFINLWFYHLLEINFISEISPCPLFGCCGLFYVLEIYSY